MTTSAKTRRPRRTREQIRRDKILAEAQAFLEDEDLWEFIAEMKEFGGDIAVRFERGTPIDIKLAVGMVFDQL